MMIKEGEIYENKLSKKRYTLVSRLVYNEEVVLESHKNKLRFTLTKKEFISDYKHVGTPKASWSSKMIQVGEHYIHPLTGYTFKIISTDYAKATCILECVKASDSGWLGRNIELLMYDVMHNYNLVNAPQSGSKVVDKAYKKLTEESSITYKLDHKGNRLEIEEWNKLYCTCDNRQAKTVIVLNVSHQVCTNCKKSIID